jgi:hypothetical protein
MNDGYIESLGDRLREGSSAFGGSSGDWALYALFAARVGHKEEMWAAVTQAAKEGGRHPLFGVLLVTLYLQLGRQYHPFLKAARAFATSQLAGPIWQADAETRALFSAFLDQMARAIADRQPAAARFYGDAAARAWPFADDLDPATVVLTHFVRPRRSQSEWRSFCREKLLGTSDARHQFALTYCALHLARDHRLIGRTPAAATAESLSSLVWLAMEEHLLHTRDVDTNPYACSIKPVARGCGEGQARGLLFWVVVGVLAVLGCVIGSVWTFRRT